MSLAGKTIFVTGASRGIGLAIALRAARDGARIAVAAKTAEPHPKLPGTIYTAAEAIEKAGGRALPLVVDVRDEAAVAAAVAKTVDAFGGVDICINNASAIDLRPTSEIDMKRFDLMHQINARGTFLTTRACLPHLRRSSSPHVLTLAPALPSRPEIVGPHTAYAVAKLGMSLCVLSFAEELRADGIASNALWPRTLIATAAVQNLLGGHEAVRGARTPDIMADAAYVILNRDARTFTGRFLLDDEVLAAEGVRDFDRYRVDPSAPLQIDLFVDPTLPLPPGVSLAPITGVV